MSMALNAQIWQQGAEGLVTIRNEKEKEKHKLGLNNKYKLTSI